RLFHLADKAADPGLARRIDGGALGRGADALLGGGDIGHGSSLSSPAGSAEKRRAYTPEARAGQQRLTGRGLRGPLAQARGRSPGNRLSAVSGSLVLEGGFTLFRKGRHAFFLVGGGEHGVEQAALEMQALGQGGFQGAVDGFLHHLGGGRGLG